MESIEDMACRERGPDPTLILMPHGITGNIYVRDLGRAYARLGYRVVFNADNLKERSVVPGLMHLHWPEEHYRWTGQGMPEKRASRFIGSLDRLKSAGALVVWTVHNITPHEHFDSDLDRNTYQAVIDRADVLMHHCEKSKQLLHEAYRVPGSAREIVVPHGNYLGYPRGVNREEARSRLDLPRDACIYLHFGAVRVYKGLDLLLKAFALTRVDRKVLVIAGRYAVATDGNRLVERIRIAVIRRFSAKIRLFLREIQDEEIQLFMAAADEVVLAHRNALNSGVAVLGMTFGKPVVGPARRLPRVGARRGKKPDLTGGRYPVAGEGDGAGEWSRLRRGGAGQFGGGGGVGLARHGTSHPGCRAVAARAMSPSCALIKLVNLVASELVRVTHNETRARCEPESG